MILHNDKETFNDLIETTARLLGISAVFIEKDYLVTYILKEVHLKQLCFLDKNNSL